MTNPGTTLIIVTAIFSALSTATTAIRIGVRARQKQLKSEDWNILAAMILLLIQDVFIGLQYNRGSGMHIWELSVPEVEDVLKYVYATEFLIFPAICLTKISICFFVLRIKNTKNLRWSLYTMMFFLVIASLMCEIVLFAQCRPLSAFWDRAAGTCWDFNIYNDIIWVQVAFSIFSDAVCTILPIVVLWKVRIPLRLKIAVCGLMGLGILATLCGAIRASLSGNDQDPDLTYSLAFISVWAVLEAHIGVIGANMALARYVWIFFFGKGESSAPSKGTWNSRAAYENYGRDRTGKQNSSFDPERSVMQPDDTVLLNEISSSNTSINYGIRKTTDIRVDSNVVA